MKNYMNDEQIMEMIHNYIDKTSYNYAILIDGGWGSGKTYFIENVLISKLKKEQNKIIYISLYGITSREELAKQILLESISLNKYSNNRKFQRASNIGKALLSSYMNYKGISLSDELFEPSNFLSLESYILIFDDLERCNMNINEVLGYINNFVEHDGIKVIIVANEKEITAPNITKSKELKYLVASNENISFSENSLISNCHKQTRNRKEISKLDVKELNKRINHLFGQDELYKLIKEKLIGITIYYRQELVRIIDIIVNGNDTDEIVKNTILNNKDYIIEKFEHYKHENIRTLFFIIDKFAYLIKNIRSELDSLNYDEVLNEIFKYMAVISVTYKSGKTSFYNWDKNEIKVIDIIGENNYYDYIKGFKVVDDFILKGIFNKKNVLYAVQREIEYLKTQVLDSNDPLYILNNEWFYLEDHEVDNLINKVNQTLLNNPQQYNIVNYSRILNHNITLNRINVIKVDINKILEIMKRNIQEFQVENIFDVFGHSFVENEDKEEYIYCIDELKKSLLQSKEETKYEILNSIFSNDKDWVNELKKYVDKYKDEFLQQKEFLSSFDFIKLMKAIKSSSNLQIIEFCSVIKNSIYNFSNIDEFYAKDKETVEMIIHDLKIYSKEIENKQKIRTNNINYLITEFEIIVKKINK